MDQRRGVPGAMETDEWDEWETKATTFVVLCRLHWIYELLDIVIELTKTKRLTKYHLHIVLQ